MYQEFQNGWIEVICGPMFAGKSEELKASLESRGTFKMPEPKVPINMRDKFLKEEQERKEKVASLPKIQEWKVNAIEDAQKNIEEMKLKERNKLDV